MTLRDALERIELIKELANSSTVDVLCNETQQFIKEQGARLHEQDNQLLEQISYCIENRKLKAEIEQLKEKNIRLLENL